MITWRYWEDQVRTGPWNMAWDHALADTVRTGVGVVRLYGWTVPTVSVGRNQTARDLYNQELATSLGIEFVRRPTGGGAVLHHPGELTYAVVVPLRALGGPRRTFSLISEGLRGGIRALGVAAELAHDGTVQGPPSAERLCFGVRAPGELSVGGRKLLGSAQARLGGALLQHGSLLVSTGQDALSKITRGGTFPEGPPTTLQAELRGAVDPAEIRRALRESLGASLGGRWESTEPSQREFAAAARQVKTYGDAAWTWRR